MRPMTQVLLRALLALLAISVITSCGTTSRQFVPAAGGTSTDVGTGT